MQAASHGRRNNASWSSNVTAEDVAIGRDSRERAEGEDYEGEDEYEDELKAVAESHEAMSRDDTRNSNASTAASAGGLAGEEASSVAKNFDSREVITVNSSDEDVASNEAITDEIVDKYDQEVRVLVLLSFLFFLFARPVENLSDKTDPFLKRQSKLLSRQMDKRNSVPCIFNKPFNTSRVGKRRKKMAKRGEI